MKIPAEASFELVYSVSIHPQLGAVLEAYVVQLTSAGNLSMVSQRVLGVNADYYGKKLHESDIKALHLLDEISPEYIVKRFSQVKKIRPREFFDKHFDETIFKQQIRPYIERRIVEVMKLIRGRRVFIKKLKNVTHTEVEWCDEPATVLFHLRKNPTNTHYFATIKHDNARVPFAQNHSILLSTAPCYLIATGKILQFESGFDGKKIAPFIHKRFIEIPERNEKTYFTKVIAPLLEKYPVHAKGIDISSEKHTASPLLRIVEHLDGKCRLGLHFKYGDYVFPYHSNKNVSVRLSEVNGGYVFHRIKRSKQWEDVKRKVLEVKGLMHVESSIFSPSSESDTNEVLEWVSENRLELQKAGFEIEQNLSRVYSIVKPELTLEAKLEGDWFDVKARLLLGGFELPIAVVRNAILEGKKEVQLPDGTYAVIPSKWIEQLTGLALLSTDRNGIRLKKHHIGVVQPFLQRDIESGGILDSFEGVQDYPISNQFIGSLRPYQKAGYDWLCFLWDIGLGGCLADDMGLGKTVQSLAFLTYVKENQEEVGSDSKDQKSLFDEGPKTRPSLLVVPTSLVYNWSAECEKFVPHLRVLTHVGINRDKEVDRLQQADLVITTYGTLRNDIEMLRDIQFDVALLDESQFIKNPTSKLAKKVNEINAKVRLTLTGTPVENTVVDLWSQMNFVNPGLLGNHRFFQKEFVKPIQKESDEVRIEQLRSIIKPFVMRRTKMQVAGDLPPKSEQIVRCVMTDEQQDIYEKIKSTYRNIILDSVMERGVSKSQIQILTGLTKLRQIANHPVLDDENYQHSSGKFEYIKEMITGALEDNHTLLIFSQFVGHLRLVKTYLELMGIEYCYLDGSVNSKERIKQVELFQDGQKRVFLISLKAGGFGLNLTAADYVFLLDPWWNPAAENQAIDRTHRIGQTQRVFSYKFISQNTVEDKILRLQKRKQELSNQLIQTEESYLKQVSVEDLEAIFQ